MASHPICQFYAELDGYKPKVWRRFQVTNNISVARLGYIIQVLFEMTASHLMAFEAPSDENLLNRMRSRHPEASANELCEMSMFSEKTTVFRYEIIDEDFESFPDPHRNVHTLDAITSKLSHAVHNVGDKLKFNYDFGDDWWVSLRLEEIFEDKALPGGELPRVLEGEGFGIVEDCGGTGGLEDLAKAFKKKKGADYKQFSAWLGVDELDLTAFDLDDMNFRLKKIPRIYKQCYEDRLTLTQQSIDLIERKYLHKKPGQNVN